MTDAHDYTDPPDDVLAAEYVLGVLDGPARAGAERRIAREPAFSALVDAWQTRLVPWTDEIAPVQPPFEVWNRIADALPAERPHREGLWRSLTLWRWLTAGAGALAVASMFVLFVVINAPAPSPLVATIEGSVGRQFVATIDPRRAGIAVVPAGYAGDPARVAELWLIAPGDKPRSLGLLRADQATALKIPADLRRFANTQAALAVSLEPPGGSPTGAPTGPVIAQGKLTAL